jgi:hypothetical protein
MKRVCKKCIHFRETTDGHFCLRLIPYEMSIITGEIVRELIEENTKRILRCENERSDPYGCSSKGIDYITEADLIA